MMKIPFYQIDAFTNKVFKGNPAAVCILDEWLEDEIMQSIAAENNLAETAFIIPSNDQYALRWFTPKLEVDLCGHATLASAFVVFNYLEPNLEVVEFTSKSGILTVTRQGAKITLNFPTLIGQPCNIPEQLEKAIGKNIIETKLARDFLVLLESEDEVKSVKPDLEILMELDALGIIVTAEGKKSDFVSRFFAPKAGIPEDPVTGSAHCTLIPYWAEKLNKNELHAFQISPRGGELFCENLGDRVNISGQAVRFCEGHIYL